MPKRRDEIHAFLGKETEVRGELKFEGTVQIDGTFRGEIHATGTLIVGEGARLEGAEINCGTLIVSGQVVGNIRATHRVEALAPARILGNIQTPVLVINEGVLLDGNIRMAVSAEEGKAREKIPFVGKREKLPSQEEIPGAGVP